MENTGLKIGVHCPTIFYALLTCFLRIYTVNVTGETLVLNKNFHSFVLGTQFSQLFQLYAGKILALCWENPCLATEFHQPRLQCSEKKLLQCFCLNKKNSSQYLVTVDTGGNIRCRACVLRRGD